MDDKKKTDTDEVADEQLEDVSGGATVIAGAASQTAGAGAIPDVCMTPAPGGTSIPVPYPNTGTGAGDTSPDSKVVVPDGGGDSG